MLPPRYDDLDDVRGLSPEEWQASDELGRLSALQEVEKRTAEAQRREPCAVRGRDFPENESGALSRDGKVIYVANRDLRADNPHEAVDTTAHESFHAYQREVIRDAGEHPEVSDNKRNNWAYNQSNYVRPEDDIDAYRAQFLEQDARAFGDDRTRQLCGQTALEHALASEQALPDKAKAHAATMRQFDELALEEPSPKPEQSNKKAFSY